MRIRTMSAAMVIAGLGVGIAACSSGGQSSLGPFTISACKLGWEDGTDDGQFFTSQSAAQDAPAKEIVTQGSEFTVTLTATADLSGGFTVAYYNSAGTEITTDTAELVGEGPSELTAGQTATFMDEPNAPISGATSCKVISGPGN
jgi:hypothetical protein